MRNNALTETTAFLKVVAPDLRGGFIELRLKYNGENRMHQEYFTAHEDAAERALELAPEADVYFGVAVRKEKGGRKEHVGLMSAIWADLDCKTDEDKADARSILRELSCRPRWVNNSGRGYHLYWPLEEPLTSETEFRRAENAMKLLAQALGGDKVHDYSRVLRLPHTLNHKYDAPLPVKIAYPKNLTNLPEGVRRYHFRDLEEMARSIAPEEPVASPDGSGGASETEIPEGERNNTLTSLAGSMRRVGFSEESILAALLIENRDRCKPPLEDTEVSTIPRSIGRYEPSADPRNFTPQLPQVVPPFPTRALPDPLGSFVREIAASIGCPEDFVAVPMLTNLGSAIGISRRIRLKPSWTESAALYSIFVAPPGSKKSAAFKEAIRPAVDSQAEYVRNYQVEMAEYQRACDAAETGDPRPPHPVQVRTTVDDITIESLTRRLAENARGIQCANDELTGFMRRMNQYKGGSGSDRQKYLSMWNHAMVTVDRKGEREPTILLHPFLSINGAIQPSLLTEVRDGREDGMLDRFLLSFPETMVSYWTDNEIRAEVSAEYYEIYVGLRNLDMPTDENGNPAPLDITPSNGAMDVFKNYSNRLVDEKAALGFPEYLKGPWSKLEAYLARLALIIGMVRISEQPEGFMAEFDTIDTADMEAAVELIDYFKAHARKVHMTLHGAQPRVRLEASVAGWLGRQGGYWEGQVQDLHSLLKSESVLGLPNGSGPLGKALNTFEEYITVEPFSDGSTRKVRLSLTSTHPNVSDSKQ